LKNKFNNNLDPIWLNQILNHDIEIKAIFNDINTSVLIENGGTNEEIDKVDYVNTVSISTKVGEENNTSKIHLYSNKKPILHFKDIRYLCFSMFKSPYFYNHEDLLNSYADSVNKKMDQPIIRFLQKIDHNIQDIKLIEKNGIKRFAVISDNFENARDLTSFGEGLQRIFEISLAFASSKNGILLIDELETAIHKSLLIDFTCFIQELAEKFNVQVFITSHSKECIDAFVQNDYKDNSELIAYLIENNNNRFSYKYIDGDRLHSLIESMDIDIRGDRSE
jgi:AAA15 family ATPase/GTPase